MEKSRVLSLLKELISTNSENPPGHEADVANVLREHMEAHGISCTSVGPNKRPNLIFSSHDGENGDLVLHGHMDTVPIGKRENWSHDPFTSDILNGRLYGRGACDMKGPVAALAETLILYTEARHENPLVMLATSDEESGCSGAEEVAASGLLDGIKYGVCAEPTSLGILVGEKGLFWSKIVSTGKSAHGSRPEEGVNAIEACIDAIRIVTSEPYPYTEDELLGNPTMNIGVIQGGIKVNVVPDTCEARLDMRVVKGQDPESLLKAMNRRLETAGLSDRVLVEYIHGKPAVLTPIDSEIVGIARDVVSKISGVEPILSTATYGTDCSVLQPKVGILHVICGPGSIEQAHQPDEYIRLDELYQSVDVYMEIARHFSD
ncbi:MAG: M20 family metallopeptidase [Candidatus Thorarchaeota archaeon]